MQTYRIFLRVAGGPTDVSIDALCNSDREARELAQRMLQDGRDEDGQAELWVASRFVGVVLPLSTQDAVKLERHPKQ